MTRASSDRAVSSAVTYSLIVVITLTLTTGLVVGTDALVGNQRDRAATEQLDVVGQRLVATIETADRLSATENDPDSLVITREFPRRVAGSQYHISVADAPSGSGSVVTLETVDSEISASMRVDVHSVGGVGETEIAGGRTVVRYDDTADELVIEHA